MAKRRRLSPACPDALADVPPAPPAPIRAPISQIAGDAASVAALSQVTEELQRARQDGRMILALELDQIDANYLVRDRLAADDSELATLIDSLRRRGQQTPIDVVETAPGAWGLISGWRRLTALRRLRDETGEARFAHIQCLVRRPDTSSDAYIAMVEENEIRAGLSYYERARIAARAVELGVYDSEKSALLALFSTASRAKRSKIRSFLPIYHSLDKALKYGQMIPERQGLALSRALQERPGFAETVTHTLNGADVGTADQEQALLTAALDGGTRTYRVPRPTDFGQSGVTVQKRKINGRPGLVLTGDGVTDVLAAALSEWLAQR